ncbi:glucose-6-phosphate isomerase [Rhodocaloribacter litoris]|uniref:glucose-6-phosphate isomerase n=1 Tax=Rhodocaloribacter litoris TaxID=2558931 RepID=UPI0014232C49|nr:glucose-6-phosphate isomerase [Rhodocaloribacter litoris]QXD13804.1 glucose-6-phosphate isomerase [Rhodocaloribacter litoris]
MLRFDPTPVDAFIEKSALETLRPRVEAAHRALIEKTGAGHEFTGWRDLLLSPNDALLEDLAATAAEIRERADVLVCIGIGGSYLGAKAVIDALTPYFPARRGDDAPRTPEILFAGHHMSGAYLRELMAYLEGKSVYLNVISKSGTTLEPALAFRFLRQWLEARFDDADRRIIVTTDPERGALNQLRAEKGYKKYVIPPDVGGRFSVLTPVGLLPIAVAGIDIHALFYGAVDACRRFSGTGDNPALDYAARRYLLHEHGYAVEVLAVFEPRLAGIGGWWQQLFGESEGKDHKGLFPAVVQYSTDLHSLGQYVQDGKRLLIETFLMAEHDGGDLPVPATGDNLDGLDYLAGQTMRHINRQAYEGTLRAHVAGGVPAMTLWLDRIAPGDLGACLYFFEHAVAVGGYLLGINPFDQPGVEAYKKEMFALLGKP